MGKPICNMRCLECIHPDCINDRPMSRQLAYYYRNREKISEKKKIEYKEKKKRGRKNESD